MHVLKIKVFKAQIHKLKFPKLYLVIEDKLFHSINYYVFRRMRLDKGNILYKGKSIINNASISFFVRNIKGDNGGNGTNGVIYVIPVNKCNLQLCSVYKVNKLSTDNNLNSG